MITITRAMNVRRYEDFELDTDDMTPEQLTAVEKLRGAELLESADGTWAEMNAANVLNQLVDEHDAAHEDYDAADEPSVTFIGGE
ncbi:hypothetical protein ACU4IU_00285 [Brevibacterium sp. CSND-B09]|uniref:hypothetical protein n=1 Tax=Brevibacterium sp. CSND-B09 TaxID=3462571 RepID=UPI00406A35F5